MNYHEYCEAVVRDAREYIEENIDYIKESGETEAFDIVGLYQHCTGSLNGSYYCNSYRAEKEACECVFDSDFHDALLNMFGEFINFNEYIDSPEGFDMLVREVAFSDRSVEIQEILKNALKEAE